MINDSQRRRILVIDDNDSIHSDFRKTLDTQSATERLAAATALLFKSPAAKASSSPAFEVETALQGAQGYEMVKQSMLDNRPYAVAFVDMRMPPGWDGVETAQHLWKADPNLQIVICTAYSDYSWQQITDALGQTDQLLILKKPFDPIEVCQLASALTEKWKLKRQAALKLDQMETMVHDRTTQLRRVAMTDKLTNLPNRAALNDHLKKSVAHAEADSAFKFAVHFLDFDRFKFVNDSLGHEIGDQLLVAIADRLRALFTQDQLAEPADHHSFAARLGGDEFVILHRHLENPAEATALAEKILAALNQPYLIDGHEIQSTVSIGTALSIPTSANILRDADTAMYRAKTQGKARCVLFSPEMRCEEVARFTMENDLRRALHQGELYLCYQPIVSLSKASLTGFEALIRWRHPQRGLVNPADFIPMAEETGLILSIGRWVIEEAARQLQEWDQRLPEASKLTMSVNCSGKQLHDPQFAQFVAATLKNSQITPDRFNIEITETVMMEKFEHALDVFKELTDVGVRLHMDDFGTGYSSLSHLHNLPHNVLKIDRSFVQAMDQPREYAAVVDAIVALAHNRGLEVVAEGVETAEHAAMLCALECDLAQGFFFSKPLNPADAEQFITTTRDGTNIIQKPHIPLAV